MSNRLSAFDRHLAEIPFKGAVLNLVSQWWFKQTSHIIKIILLNKVIIYIQISPSEENANHSPLNLSCVVISLGRLVRPCGHIITKVFGNIVAIPFLMV